MALKNNTVITDVRFNDGQCKTDQGKTEYKLNRGGVHNVYTVPQNCNCELLDVEITSNYGKETFSFEYGF